MQVTNPPTVSANQFYLIAAARGVNANSLGTTSVPFQNNLSASNTLPMFIRVLGKSGTFSLMIATVLLNSVVIQTISAAASVLVGSGADPLIFPTSSTVAAAIIPVSGAYQITVGTINGSAATLDVEVWGMKIS